MLRSDSPLRQAELAILNAPFAEDGWRLAVEAVADSTGSRGAQLLGLGGPALLPLNVCVGNFAGYEHYFTDPALHGAGNWRVGSAGKVLSIQHEPHYAAHRDRHRSADYDDAVSDIDIPYGCQSALLLDANHLLGLALLRGRRQGPCDAATLAHFTRLRHQMARAIRLQLALDGEAAELMLAGTAEARTATLLLDRHGAVCALTAAAEALLGEEGPLAMAGLALRLLDRRADADFQGALGRLLASDGVDGAVLHRARIEGGRLVITRLPSRPHGLGFDPHVAVTFRPAA